MNKTMYEVNWHYDGDDDTFSHCSVTPVTVVSESGRRGITAIDHQGLKFRGSPEDYHGSVEEAWRTARLELVAAIADSKSEVAKKQAEIEKMQKFLESVEQGGPP